MSRPLVEPQQADHLGLPEQSQAEAEVAREALEQPTVEPVALVAQVSNTP
jgi:hypothetical protein